MNKYYVNGYQIVRHRDYKTDQLHQWTILNEDPRTGLVFRSLSEAKEYLKSKPHARKALDE